MFTRTAVSSVGVEPSRSEVRARLLHPGRTQGATANLACICPGRVFAAARCEFLARNQSRGEFHRVVVPPWTNATEMARRRNLWGPRRCAQRCAQQRGACALVVGEKRGRDLTRLRARPLKKERDEVTGRAESSCLHGAISRHLAVASSRLLSKSHFSQKVNICQ